MVNYFRIGALIIFSFSSISLVVSLLFNLPTIPGEFAFFCTSLLLFAIYFVYSSLERKISTSERIAYIWLAVFLVGFHFFMNRFPGGNFTISLSFFSLIGIFFWSFLTQAKGKKFDFPVKDIPLITYVLSMIIIFMLLTPPLFGKYEKIQKAHELKQGVEPR
jgi:hypothetical protein